MSFDEGQSQRQAVRVPGALSRRRLLRALAWVGVMVPALRVAAQTGPDPRAGTLLRAARDGDLDAVRRALDAGVPIESRDADDRTPLLLATDRAHLPVVLLLIERGADVNARDRQQDSAFLLASARGYTEIVRATLRAGADLASTNRYGGTALIPACHHGHLETVRLLLATRINVDHVNRLGWTALLEAVILGDGGPTHQQIVRLLLGRKAQPDLADSNGVTPLQHAERRGYDEIAQLLRAAGAR